MRILILLRLLACTDDPYIIGYNLNVMRLSACLVSNPIMVDNYAAFFNCTPVGRDL